MASAAGEYSIGICIRGAALTRANRSLTETSVCCQDTNALVERSYRCTITADAVDIRIARLPLPVRAVLPGRRDPSGTERRLGVVSALAGGEGAFPRSSAGCCDCWRRVAFPRA